MKITILSPYPKGTAPSQRFRYEHYLKYLDQSNIDYNYFSFYSVKTWEKLYNDGNTIDKIIGIVSSFLARFKHIARARSSQYILIHREITPIGPPIFEWILSKVFSKKIIYDFDDAIWLPNTSKANQWISRLKWHGKVKWICSWSYKVSCGNKFLADYARQFNAHVEVLPTVVNTEEEHFIQPKNLKEIITIGWTGSHSTLKYLEPIVSALQELEETQNIEFLVIANKNPHLNLKNYSFIPWNKETEIKDLSNIDVGVMPLQDDEWAKGKCGFKAIQYLALGIPAVVSPVGINDMIVQHERSGYLVNTQVEWKSALSKLIEDYTLRTQMGKVGRNHIVHNYSVKATKQQFINLFT